MRTSRQRDKARPVAVPGGRQGRLPRAKGVAPFKPPGATPNALRWPWSVRAADLARLDRFVAAIPDADLRAAAVAVVGEGLRRRYRLSQLMCGNAPENYDGLLGLLLTHLQRSAAALPSYERSRAAADTRQGCDGG